MNSNLTQNSICAKQFTKKPKLMVTRTTLNLSIYGIWIPAKNNKKVTIIIAEIIKLRVTKFNLTTPENLDVIIAAYCD